MITVASSWMISLMAPLFYARSYMAWFVSSAMMSSLLKVNAQRAMLVVLSRERVLSKVVVLPVPTRREFVAALELQFESLFPIALGDALYSIEFLPRDMPEKTIARVTVSKVEELLESFTNVGSEKFYRGVVLGENSQILTARSFARLLKSTGIMPFISVPNIVGMVAGIILIIVAQASAEHYFHTRVAAAEVKLDVLRTDVQEVRQIDQAVNAARSRRKQQQQVANTLSASSLLGYLTEFLDEDAFLISLLKNDDDVSLTIQGKNPISAVDRLKTVPIFAAVNLVNTSPKAPDSEYQVFDIRIKLREFESQQEISS